MVKRAFPLLQRFLCLIALILVMNCGGGGGGDSSGGNGSSSSGSSSSSSSGGAAGNGPFVVIDQFGYLPDAEKVAVIRDPQSGFDQDDAYEPGDTFEVVNAATDDVVFSGSIQQWNSGNTDTLMSGDRAWWFDFSSVQTEGEYFVRDAEHDVVSHTFLIDDNVYDEVLKQAMRTFFYQRAGFAKDEPFAESGWEGDASHLGPQQDGEARLYSAPNDDTTERDLSGGWYDAGDYNKYTNWTADYVIGLLHAYTENPAAWSGDFNIPESDDDIPDIINEIKWGMDWLIKMQDGSNAGSGSVLSIVGLSHENSAGGNASPPSSASGPSYYGPASTSATLTTAAAFALGSTVFAALDGDDVYAAELEARAIDAWDWAVSNPNVIFRNNDPNPPYESAGLGAGQQEVDDDGRLMKKLEAAVYLFEMTGDAGYQTFFDGNYEEAELIESSFSSAFRVHITHFLLYYANLPGATPSVADNIEQTFVNAMNSGNTWLTVDNEVDPYRAYLADYTWGSSGFKANKGSMYYEQILYDLQDGRTDEQIRNVAARYIHYLHGVNPLGKVYLSNMGDYGAENSVDQFYHTWFAHGSALWDSVSGSTYGPAPGFVVGGPNPFYDWDACCNSSCGSPQNDAMCGTQPLSPPFGQPPQKSYLDFNQSWPLNSWEVTENSNGYQIRYLRLLSKFVQ